MRDRWVSTSLVLVTALLSTAVGPAAALDSTLTAVRADPFTSPPRLADGTPLDGAGVTIAIVDSGVDGTHPMFTEPDGSSAVVRNLETACPDELTGAPQCLIDVPTNDSDTTSASGHGTAVASIAAGRPYTALSGVMLQGVASGASLVAISTGTATTGVGTRVAFDWIARNHADPCGDGSCPPIRVINASFTTDEFERYPPDDPVSVLQEQLIAAGITIAWGAGNSGGDGSEPQTNPWAQTPTPGAIMVGASDELFDGRRDGPVAEFSSRGERGRPETYPDLVAPGGITTWACRPHLALCGVDNHAADPNVGSLGGTSASAPYVAGAAALLLQAAPGLSPAEIEFLLERTAHPFGDPVPWEDDPAHPGTLTSFDRGHGLLDVAAAIRSLQGLAYPPVHGCPTVVRDGIGDVRAPTPQLGLPVDAPHLDLTRVDLTDDPLTGDVRVTLSLTGWEPANDATYAVAFDLGVHNLNAQEHRVEVALTDGTVARATATGPDGSFDVPVRIDRDHASVTWYLPEDLGPTSDDVHLRGGPRLTNFAATSNEDDVTDRGAVRCAFHVGRERVRRLAGADRYATSVAVSRAGYGDAQAPAVVLARGDDPDDAVVAGPLASALGAPLLLTRRDELPPQVAAEIDRVTGPDGRVIVVGGPLAITTAVTDRLTTAELAWERVWGADRYATATRVAEHVGGDGPTVVAATRSPDALVAGALAARERGVLLLTPGDEPTPETNDALARRAGTERIALGGPAARAYPRLTALAGPDRYATAALAATRAADAIGVGLVRADPVADGLVAAPHLAARGAPLLLDHPDVSLTVCDRDLRTLIVGGPVAIPTTREASLRCRSSS